MTNTFKRLFFMLLIFELGLNSNAQELGVLTHYNKDDKSTEVETILLPIYDTTDQYVKLKLRTSYKGDRMTKPPNKVIIELFSISDRPLYTNEALNVIADGVSYRMGTLNNLLFKERTDNGVEGSFELDSPLRVTMKIAVPPAAKIRGGDNLNKKILEVMGLTLKPEQFLTLARAAKLELRLRNSSFTLDDQQMDVVRNFAKQVNLQ
jgi:hypothetical protein